MPQTQPFEPIEAVQKEIAAPTEAVVGDLANASDPLAWLSRAEELHGPVDVLVNNAGISFIEPTEGIEAERIATLFQVNVHTPIGAIQHVLPAMLARGGGTIVNVASVAAFTHAPYMCHYHATKGALGNFSESLRMELKRSGVHVLTVYPGPVHTPMAERNYDQFKNSDTVRRAPTGDTKTLAGLVQRALDKKKARVIYPGFYRIAWWFPSVARFVTERADPQVVGSKTPPMPGDVDPMVESGSSERV